MSKISTLPMHRNALTLIVPIAVTAFQTASAMPAAMPAKHPDSARIAFYKQDTDPNMDTGSDSDGSYDVFYDRLSSDGRWFYDDDYGYVWQPNVAASTPDWRPYADGHWVWTDRGWYWDSGENFGWATYHYGRWALLDEVGWIWIPGSNWAPAWVSWRQTSGADYVGWAPLPPESRFNPSIGFHGWSDSYYDIGPAAYAFIRIGDFARPSYREFCLPQQQSVQIIQQTTNITNITYVNNVVNNYGPPHDRIAQLVQQQSGQTLPSYKLNYAAQTQPNAAFKTSIQGNQLNVAAPPYKLKTVAAAAPQVSRQLGKTQVNRGWQNVPQAQAQQLRQQYAQQAPVPKILPAKPVLPVKPQIQAGAKPGAQGPNATGTGNATPAPRTEVKSPGTAESAKPNVQAPAATPAQQPKTPQTAAEKKPEISTPAAKAEAAPVSAGKPPGNEAKKDETKKEPAEQGKRESEPKAARSEEKTPEHAPAEKPKPEEAKKPTPPASSETNHPESQPVAHQENHPEGYAEHHVAAEHSSKPADAPSPHHTPSSKEKKEPEKTDKND